MVGLVPDWSIADAVSTSLNRQVWNILMYVFEYHGGQRQAQ